MGTQTQLKEKLITQNTIVTIKRQTLEINQQAFYSIG
jgi:hypothetical protein